MNFICALLIAAFANVDAFIVGLSYGIKNIKIGITTNFIIGGMAFIGTLLAMTLGNFITLIFPVYISNLIGGVLLVFIALFTLVKSYMPSPNEYDYKPDKYQDMLNNPEQMDSDKSGFIDNKEAILVGFILAINNIGIGISASITDISIIFTSLLTLILSIICIFSGYIIGKKYLSKKFNNSIILFSCLLLIILGIHEIFS